MTSGSLDIEMEVIDKNKEDFSLIWLMKNGFQEKGWIPNEANPSLPATLDGRAGDDFDVIVRHKDG